MEHNHSHGHGHMHGHVHDHAATGNIAVAFFVNLGFAVVELAGGLWTNSIAILSDAFHDFGDSLSLAVAWRLQKVSERPSDSQYSYGYKRFSLLGALFISTVLLVGSVFIMKECIGRILAPQEPNAQGMLWLAVFGVLVNGFAALRLHKGGSISERAVMLHMMEDVLGWIAVLVVSVVMLFVYVPILDPLLSIGISCWVLYNVYRNLKATFRVLLQHTPSDIDAHKLEAEIVALPEVESIHDLHLWSLDGERNISTLHVVTAKPLDCGAQVKLKEEIRTVCARNGIDHATVELETEGEDCGLTHCSH
ncbi:cation diffusion facilitator family transporter [uncultured Rikenella sp.]|uniref:cation diffusion facilitator family transporter n=1 Tax=uncultured Rikenella sp. TaxID=368003 RepID=UPI002633C708|nr:cation diffusion facilitator family transporter [uncultured Rikenella sp.]